MRSGRLAKPQSQRKASVFFFRGQHGLGGAVSCGVVLWRGAGRGIGGVLCHVWREDPGGTLGLGHMSEVVFHRSLLGGSFGGMIKGGCLPGTGEWTCSNCGKTDCWRTRHRCNRCRVPRYFDGSGMGKVNLVLVQAKVEACRVSRIEVLGLG